MVRRSLLTVAGMGCMLLLACGCAPEKFHFTGFLDDYGRLEPHPTKEHALVYYNQDVDWTRYKRAHVQPIALHFADPKEEREVSPEQLERFRQITLSAIQDVLARHDLEAPQPGDGVAELRVQIANIRLTRVIESHQTTFRTQRHQLGSCNAETELVDPQTGTILAMYVSRTVPPEWVESWSDLDEWESLEAYMRRGADLWAETAVPKFLSLTRPNASSVSEEDGA
jgi:hypothetical protein